MLLKITYNQEKGMIDAVIQIKNTMFLNFYVDQRMFYFIDFGTLTNPQPNHLADFFIRV